jgi:glycerol-3-phosphate dehydrogenase (NAD(P)+)
MSGTRETVAVVGSGSWGSALAYHLARAGHEVRLWARRRDQAEEIQETRENGRYLPGIHAPEGLRATCELPEALAGATLVLTVVPSQITRQVWTEARRYLPPRIPVISASKGIENMTLALMSQVLADVLPEHPLGFVAGPSFAKEVARGLPTAIVVGAEEKGLADHAQRVFSNDAMRAYSTTDVVGIEVGGALKNVIAIATGCADGLGFGHNTRAAIITRGLAEITRMAVKLGADPLTLAGLGGMGDLVLTCCGDLSRNRRVGLGLGEGKALPTILHEMGQVAEGVQTAISGRDLAQREGVEMPICEEMCKILHDDKPARQVVTELMRRGLKDEKA